MVEMRRRLALVLMLFGLWPGLACAHLMPAQRASVNVVGHSAFIVVSTPASALTGVDTDNDGQLSALEIGRGSPAITAQFQSGFSLMDDGKPGVVIFTWAMAPSQDAGSSAAEPYVVVLQRVDFPAPPTKLAVHSSLFGSGGQLTLLATAGAKTDLVVLNARNPGGRLFRSPLEIFAAYVQLGFAHVLAGFDHLLFLLTIVVAARRWRSLFAVTTAFTLAHSLTLGFAVFGWVQVPAQVIEPAIALSIVLMAADNLIRGARVGRERLALVVGCGLLHGLGFASALEGFGLGASQRLAGLVGFNVGVEAGQLSFLLAVLALAALGRRLFVAHWEAAWPRAASAAAGLAGLSLLAARLI